VEIRHGSYRLTQARSASASRDSCPSGRVETTTATTKAITAAETMATPAHFTRPT
jgi:hypothetical protein